MKTLVISLTLILFAGFLSAQETPEDNLSKKEIRKRKKDEKEAKLQKQYEANYQILFERSFVLEANSVEGKDGYRINVNPRLNFLIIDSANSVLQVGIGTKLGYNGVGGSTAKGKITSYKISKNDIHKSCSLSMMVNTKSGYYRVSIDVSAYGNANAWVLGMTYGDLRYNGYIVPLSESKVFKGTVY
jgi:hypothetical protein